MVGHAAYTDRVPGECARVSSGDACSSGAHGRNGRDPAVDQEVCADDVRRIVRREVDRQLRDFQRIGDPLAWIVGSEDALERLALLFTWEATEHRGVRRTWAFRVFTRIPRPMSSALRIRARW